MHPDLLTAVAHQRQAELIAQARADAAARAARKPRRSLASLLLAAVSARRARRQCAERSFAESQANASV